MKKVISIISAVVLSATIMTAQNNDFNPHWFMQLQGGAAHTIGETTFTKLLSPAAAASIGYQFSPALGARLNVNGWQAKGYVTNGGVYKFNFVEGAVDLLLGGCSDSFISPYLFAGIGANYAFNNDEANALKAHFPPENYLWDGSKILPAARAGVGFNFRLSDAIALNLECTSNFLMDQFNSKVGSKADFQLNALAGLTFCFGRKAKKAAPVVAPVVPVEPAKPAPKPEPKPEPVVEKAAEPVVAAPVWEPLTKYVYFERAKTEIRPSEQIKIDELVAFLNANPDTKVSIKAYADKATGNAKINKRLSVGRAAVVAKALKAAGIAADRISTEDFGDTVNPYPTPEENRVSVCVVDK